jgi:cell division protein FtsB
MNLFLRKSGVLAVILIIGAYAFIAARGPNGLPALLEKRARIRELQEQNASLAADNERKRQRISRLKTSRAEQELEIRERLKMMKPGETQFILPEAPKPALQPPPSANP